MQLTPKIKKSLSKTSLAQDSPGAAENLRQHLDGDFTPHALDNRKALPGGQEGQAHKSNSFIFVADAGGNIGIGKVAFLPAS